MRNTNHTEQAVGILRPPINSALQELRRALIANAMVRVERVAEEQRRYFGKLKPSFSVSSLASCARHLDTARYCLGLLSLEPPTSDSAFLKLHELAAQSIEFAGQDIAVAVAWHGSTAGPARKKAYARHMADPKSAEKIFVKDCWDEWQESTLRYKSKAEFARDMLNKCEHLKSQKKIEDWCRQWERGRSCNPASRVSTVPALKF